MAKVTMYQGETLIVQFADTDGEFTIDFNSRAYPDQLVVRESDGIKGNVKGGANEILYHERFGPRLTDLEDVADGLESPHPPVGFFVDSEGRLQCTALVNCYVREAVEIAVGDYRVVTVDHEGTETGEFTFFESIADLEKALGGPVARITI